MNSVATRLNQLLSYVTMAFGVLAAFVFLSNFWLDQPLVGGKLVLNAVSVRQARNYAISRDPIDVADIKFSLDLDLEPMFHWNCKQVFLKAIAVYSTNNNVENQVTVWDMVVLKAHNHKIRLRENRQKYTLEDDGAGLRNTTVKLLLEVERIPHIGVISISRLENIPPFQTPHEYGAVKRF